MLNVGLRRTHDHISDFPGSIDTSFFSPLSKAARSASVIAGKIKNIFKSLRTKGFDLKSELVQLISTNYADRISHNRILKGGQKVSKLEEMSGAIDKLADALVEQLNNEERKFSGNDKTARSAIGKAFFALYAFVNKMHHFTIIQKSIYIIV